MLLALMLVFVAVPLLEIALLIKIGTIIDFWPTLGLVIGTAVIGTAIMRHQGLSALMKAQSSMSEGQLPVEPVIDGAFLLVAGAFLLTPGLITDSIGFLFLVPPFRRWFARWAYNKFVKAGKARATVFTQSWEDSSVHRDPTDQGSSGKHDNNQTTVIEGEFERLDDKPVKPRRPK